MGIGAAVISPGSLGNSSIMVIVKVVIVDGMVVVWCFF